MGRNIWQSDYPVAMIQAVRSVVHEGFDVESAYRKFLSLKQSKVSKRELQNRSALLLYEGFTK